MKGGWLLASACLLGLFALALVAALDFPLLDELGPGPGFFPFWLSLLGAILSIVLLAAVWRAPADEDAAVLPYGADAVRVGTILAALVAAAVVLEPLGYRLTTLFFIALLLAALGVRSPIALGACALAGSFGVFHVFYYWLKVPLPRGAWGI